MPCARFLTLLPLIGLLIGCVATPPPPARDAHVPDFARRPYEPFNRTAAVAIALREWRLFGSPIVDEDPRDRLPIDPELKRCLVIEREKEGRTDRNRVDAEALLGACACGIAASRCDTGRA